MLLACPALRLGGWTPKLLNVASMACLARRLGRWTLQNYSMLTHVKTGGKKNSTLPATIFWILYSKSWNFDSRLGGCETRVIDAYFSNFWKIKTRRLKTDLTLSLIL